MKKNHNLFVGSLHIFVLFGFAVALPLFDLLSRNATFFIVRRSSPFDIVLFVLFLCFFLPALLVLCEALLGRLHYWLRQGFHLLLVAFLISLIAIQVLKKIGGIDGQLLVVFSVLLGVALGVQYYFSSFFRLFVTLLLPSIFIFPILFIFASPVAKIMFPVNLSYATAKGMKSRVPIVMVVFDEFPVTSLMDENHEIDPVRYPHFAALAKTSYWFRNATAVGDDTTYAVPAILSGLYPSGLPLPLGVEYPNNLFTLLSDSYRMNVTESLTMLCPDSICGGGKSSLSLWNQTLSLLTDVFVIYGHMVLPPNFQDKLPSVSYRWKDFLKKEQHHLTSLSRGEVLTAIRKKKPLNQKPPGHPPLFRAFTASIRRSEEPTLNFLHVFLPHSPWIYFPSGKTYISDYSSDIVSPGGHLEYKWINEDFSVRAFQRHLLQVGFVDTLLGELIDRLKSEGIYDESLIVITADHGVCLQLTDQLRLLTKTNYKDILPVPLFIKVPFQTEGKIDDRNIQTIDILPTMATALNVQLPWAVDGQSALSDSFLEKQEKVVFTSKSERMVFSNKDLEAKDDTLRRKIAVFGTKNLDGLFKIGPYPEWIGKKYNEIGIIGNSDLEIELDERILFDHVAIDSAFAPAFIQGRIHLKDEGAEPLVVAVVVNDFIWGTMETYRLNGVGGNFAITIPEKAFQNGKNQIEIFIVSKESEKFVLKQARFIPSVTYSLTTSKNQGGEALVSSDGRLIPIVPNAVNARLDGTILSGNFITFYGWAADVTHSQVPETIVIFVNGKFLDARPTNGDRPDVAKAFSSPALLKSGFSFVFPERVIPNFTNTEIRFFAISKWGVATELTYPTDYKQNARALSKNILIEN